MGSHSCMGLRSLTLVHFMAPLARRRLLLLLRGGRTGKQVSTRLEMVRILKIGNHESRLGNKELGIPVPIPPKCAKEPESRFLGIGIVPPLDTTWRNNC